MAPARAVRTRDRPPLDPWRAIGHQWGEELATTGSIRRVLTVFLAGAECPFSCTFCDLWKHTLTGPTPHGAIPTQLAGVLADQPRIPPEAGLKLYNASNYFEARAVPERDDAEVARLARPFARVTVECHARLLVDARGETTSGGRRCLAFANRLDGRLEVALGLETIHPRTLSDVDKGMSVPDFDRAVDFLRRNDIRVRAFVLIGLPRLARDEAIAWEGRTVGHALRAGAGRVGMIPLRSGGAAPFPGGGPYAPASGRAGLDLSRIELGFEAGRRAAESARRNVPARAGPRGIVELDLWDIERFSRCSACGEARLVRLGRLNLGRRAPRCPPCPECSPTMAAAPAGR